MVSLESTVPSVSRPSLRQRPDHPGVRSTTRRCRKSTNPVAPSGPLANVAEAEWRLLPDDIRQIPLVPLVRTDRSQGGTHLRRRQPTADSRQPA